MWSFTEHVIGHQASFFDLAFLVLGQPTKYFPHALFQLLV
jgi:hypothetical protein